MDTEAQGSVTWVRSGVSELQTRYNPDPRACVPDGHFLCVSAEAVSRRPAMGGRPTETPGGKSHSQGKGPGGWGHAARTHLAVMMRTAVPIGPEYTP